MFESLEVRGPGSMVLPTVRRPAALGISAHAGAVAVILTCAYSAMVLGQTARRGKPDRLPVPTTEAQQKAEALIRDVYKPELTDADAPSKQLALAKRFVDEAAKTTDSPAARFALLKLACKMAAEVGDAELLCGSIDEMSRHFEIDAGRIKKTMLMRAAESPRDSAVARHLAEACLRLMDRAVTADGYDAALDYGRAAYTAAGKAKDPALVNDIVARGRRVVELQKEFERVGEAAERLATDPDDMEANLICGRHTFLVKGNWRRGLPMLAKGSNPELKAAALKDLAQPAAVGDQVAVADAWWDMAEGKADRAAKALRDRAAYWYRKAQPQATGLDKTKATNRLAEWKGFARSKRDPKPKPSKPVRAPAKAAKTLDMAPGEWADVLGRIDPKKNRIAGDWQFRGGKLVATPAGGSAGVIVPVIPRGPYELQVEFTRTTGGGLLGVVLPVGPRQCLAALDCRPGVHGLDTIGQKRADDNESTSRALSTGRQYRLDISVSADGTEASVTVNLDDRPLFFYRGPAASLALHKEFATKQRTAPALVARCGAVFHSVKLRMKSGKALLLP